MHEDGKEQTVCHGTAWIITLIQIDERWLTEQTQHEERTSSCSFLIRLTERIFCSLGMPNGESVIRTSNSSSTQKRMWSTSWWFSNDWKRKQHSTAKANSINCTRVHFFSIVGVKKWNQLFRSSPDHGWPGLFALSTFHSLLNGSIWTAKQRQWPVSLNLCSCPCRWNIQFHLTTSFSASLLLFYYCCLRKIRWASAMHMNGVVLSEDNYRHERSIDRGILLCNEKSTSIPLDRSMPSWPIACFSERKKSPREREKKGNACPMGHY